MTPADAHWWLNFLALSGIAILAVPVWSPNYRKKKLKEIRDALPERAESFKEKVRVIVKDKRGRDVADWRRTDEICLFVGYICLLGSAFFRLFVSSA